MKNLVLVMLAVLSICFVSCDGKGTSTESTTKTVKDTVWNPDSIKAVILDSTKADSLKVYDLNGDGKVDVSDLTIAINHKNQQADTTASK